MKIKKIIQILYLIPIFLFFGCSDDDNVIEFGNNVDVDINQVGLNPGESILVNIIDGNGAYTIKSTNEEIASATINGTTIDVKAHKSGNASVIITDEMNRNSFVYVHVYGEITFEEESIMLFYNSVGKVKIATGNGEYTIKSIDENLMASFETDIDGTYVVVESKTVEMENGVVEVADKSGRSATFTVKVIEEMRFIKEDETERIIFAERVKKMGDPGVVFNKQGTWPNFIQFDFKENNNSGMHFRIVIPTKIDIKILGVKPKGPQIVYNFSGYTSGDRTSQSSWLYVDDDTFEVIKYDEKTNKFWAVFYAKGKRGIICMTVPY